MCWIMELLHKKLKIDITHNKSNFKKADKVSGKIVFEQKCSACHGTSGQVNSQIKQNRASIGLGFNITTNTRVDIRYILRNRYANTSKWENDHVLMITLFSDFLSK